MSQKTGTILERLATLSFAVEAKLNIHKVLSVIDDRDRWPVAPEAAVFQQPVDLAGQRDAVPAGLVHAADVDLGSGQLARVCAAASRGETQETGVPSFEANGSEGFRVLRWGRASASSNRRWRMQASDPHRLELGGSSEPWAAMQAELNETRSTASPRTNEFRRLRSFGANVPLDSLDIQGFHRV